MFSYLAALLGEGGPTADVWVTRITLIVSIVTPQVILIIKVLQGRDAVNDAATALGKRMDSADALIAEHHQANTDHLERLEAKISAIGPTPAP